MIYSKAITTPAATLSTAPARTIIPITSGLLYSLELEFPPGCAGLLHFQLFDGKYQFFPASPGESVASDGNIIKFDDLYIKEAAPHQFIAVTWNNDATFSHTVQIRLGLVSQDVFKSRYLPSIDWREFADLMQQALVEQYRIIQKQVATFNQQKSETKNDKR